MLVFVGSNSSKSINVQLTKSVLIALDLKHEYIDLRLLDIPLFSEDLEQQIKSPKAIIDLKDKIDSADTIFITTNEHNGTISAFLKNILDWLSRLNVKFLENKKVFILSASKGKRGGLGANETMQEMVQKFGCSTFQFFAFSSFSDNFDSNSQSITNQEFLNEIKNKLNSVLNQ